MTQPRYPLLEEDVAKAALLRLDDGYEFRLFSIGERAQSLKPRLLEEVVNGLAYEATDISQEFDTLVVVQPGGLMWGALLARQLTTNLKIITLEPSSSDNQISIQLTSGFAKGRKLYFPDFLPKERVILLDDVLSSGQLAVDVVGTIRKTGAEVQGVLYIIDKHSNVPMLQKTLGIPVRTLIAQAKEAP